MSDSLLPLTDVETFGALSLPEQLNLLRPRVEGELLDALYPPDPITLFEMLGIRRGELNSMTTEDWAKWAAAIELAYCYGLTVGRIVASGFRIGGAR